MKKHEEIPHYEQIINMLHEGQITKTAFNQLLLQNQELRNLWEHYQMLEKALKEEDFLKTHSFERNCEAMSNRGDV